MVSKNITAGGHTYTHDENCLGSHQTDKAALEAIKSLAADHLYCMPDDSRFADDNQNCSGFNEIQKILDDRVDRLRARGQR